jgi:chromosome segregation ATPase
LDSFTNALKFRNDIDTVIFRRYFLAIFSRLNSYKYLSSKLSSELGVANETNFELQECKIKQEQKVLEQNNAIKLLLDKTKELERANDKSDQQISTLRKELKLISDNLISLQTTADKQASKIREQENTIRTHEKEIDRLRNLKWHQKLFGEK